MKTLQRSFIKASNGRDADSHTYKIEYLLIRPGCQRCKDKTGYIVHHINHITPQTISNFDVTLNHNNLEYLCKECHDLEPAHWKDKKFRARTLCMFDDKGNAIEPKVDRRKKKLRGN